MRITVNNNYLTFLQKRRKKRTQAEVYFQLDTYRVDLWTKLEGFNCRPSASGI